MLGAVTCRGPRFRFEFNSRRVGRGTGSQRLVTNSSCIQKGPVKKIYSAYQHCTYSNK